MKRVVLIGGLAAALAGCETTPREVVVSNPECAAHRFEVYFAEGQATLTPAARSAISLTSTQLQPCQITGVKVLGLASGTGTTSENMGLSQQRAVAVAEALAAAGWPAAQFEVAAAGDQGAQVTAAIEEPMRRRTEVLVEARPR